MATNKGTLSLGGARRSANVLRKNQELRDRNRISTGKVIVPQTAFETASTRTRKAYLPKTKKTFGRLSQDKDLESEIFSNDFDPHYQPTLLNWEQEQEMRENNKFRDQSVITTPERYTTSEQVFAGFITEAGPTVSAAFIQAAKESINNPDINAVHPVSFQDSRNPAEAITYMASLAYGGSLNMKKLLQEVSAGHNQNDRTFQGNYELTSRRFSRDDLNYNELVKTKTPMEKMLDIVGAKTISKSTSKQDVITPDAVDYNISDDQKFKDSIARTSLAFGNLANLYVPDELGKGARREMKQQIVIGMGKLMPNKISDYLTSMQKTRGNTIPPPWTNTLPTLEEISGQVSASTASLLESPDRKINKDNRPVINNAIAEVRRTLAFGNARGITRQFDPKYKEAKYITDELVAAGADPSHMVLSQSADRDAMHEFRVATDPSETLNAALSAVGMDVRDLRDQEKANLVRKVISQGLESDATLEASMKAMTPHGQSVQNTLNKHIDKMSHMVTSSIAAKEQEQIMLQRAIPKEMGSYRQVTNNPIKDRIEATTGVYGTGAGIINESTSMYRPVFNQLQKDETTMQLEEEAARRTAERRAAERASAMQDIKRASRNKQKGISNQTPEEARADWIQNNPDLLLLGSDGKNPDGSVNREQHEKWLKERAKRATSSGMAYMKGEAISDTEGPASKILRANLGIQSGGRDLANTYTRSGNLLQNVALDWYRENVDSTTFDPGLIINKNIKGQSATPDAMARSGKRVVEVKSRQELIDPNRPGGKLEELQKNYMQMQHQMYITGTSEADLVQIRRGENPNMPASGKAKGDKSDFLVTEYQIDQELQNRMKPVWNAMGNNASKIADLNEKDKKALAEAVETGNIKSFETLSKKHGLDFTETGAVLGKGGGGGGGGGGSGSGKGFWSYIGSQKSGMTAANIGHTALATGGKFSKGLNIAAVVAGAAKDLIFAGNDNNLDVAWQASMSGMSDRDWIQRRGDMQRDFSMTDDRASQDMQSLATAAGGIRVGQTSGMENMVASSLGIIRPGDVARYDGDAAAFVSKMKVRVAERYGEDPQGDMILAAMAKSTGLNFFASTDSMNSGKQAVNWGVATAQEKALLLAEDGQGALGNLVLDISKDIKDMPTNMAKAFDKNSPYARRQGVKTLGEIWDDVIGADVPQSLAVNLTNSPLLKGTIMKPGYTPDTTNGDGAANNVNVTVKAAPGLQVEIDRIENKQPGVKSNL